MSDDSHMSVSSLAFTRNPVHFLIFKTTPDTCFNIQIPKARVERNRAQESIHQPPVGKRALSVGKQTTITKQCVARIGMGDIYIIIINKKPERLN